MLFLATYEGGSLCWCVTHYTHQSFKTFYYFVHGNGKTLETKITYFVSNRETTLDQIHRIKHSLTNKFTILYINKTKEICLLSCHINGFVYNYETIS